MLEQKIVDTTQTSADLLSIQMAELIKNRRAPLVVLDGMGGCGKTTVAKRVKDILVNQNISAEVLGLDDEKEMHASKRGRCGLDEPKSRTVDLVRDHMKDLSGTVNYRIYNFQTESQNKPHIYRISGRSSGVLIVEGLGASKVFAACPSTFTGPILHICFTTDESLRLERKFLRAKVRQPQRSIPEIQERMQRHLRMTLGYEKDMKGLNSNNFLKKDQL